MQKIVFTKIFFLILLIIFASACGLPASFESLFNYGDTSDNYRRSFIITDKIAVSGVEKIGLNLGFATSWGAEQLNANIVKNPGFEGTIDRAVVIVKNSSPGNFSDSETFLGRPDNFWENAVFDVRTGRFAGRTGKIISSRRIGASGLPDFSVDDAGLMLDAGDVVALTRTDDSGIPARWWIAKDSENLVGVNNENTRPNSGGRRTLALLPQNGKSASVSSYFDAIGEKAGKMLPVNGAWRLSFWSLSKNGNAELSVSFGRQNSTPFVRKTFAPKTIWKRNVFNFNAKDIGANGILELNFKASGEAGEILLDDVELFAIQDEKSAFRSEVINALKEIQPGFLRDWQGQLGDTIENRLAERNARLSVRVRPENLEAADFYYSIPEFLDLCEEIKANPWLIVPTTASDAELEKLGAYLSENKDRFSEIIVEFGNENWNSIFRVAGISDAQKLGEAANRAFAKIRDGVGNSEQLKFVIGGQHANPDAALDFIVNTKNADVLAVAPYFLYKLADQTDTSENLDQLFAGDGGRMKKIAVKTRELNKDLAVYEVNLHTTGGGAKSSDRDEITAGAAAGTALAKVLLDNLTLGVKRQCVYTFTGFDAKTDDGKNAVKLWGIVRDLGETKRFRPQGMALIMLNRAIKGDLNEIPVEENSETDVSVYAFKNKEKRSTAIVSNAPRSREVSLTFPPDSLNKKGNFKLLSLDAKNPTDTNETAEKVKITEVPFQIRGNVISFELNPYGFAVLLDEN